MQQFINLLLHFDKHLAAFSSSYGLLVYGLCFLIIFSETGIIITSFLPGDSLLFAIGALTAGKIFPLSVYIPWLLLIAAAFLGDALNYQLGKHFGRKIFTKNNRFFNIDKLKKAEDFYNKHGGKAIILARFIPFARTFAPFVAGISNMNYFQFARFNIFGAIFWVTLFLGLGYFFGTIPFVQHNFHYLMFGIIGFSLIPVALEMKHSGHKNPQSN
jgi:membrane-associated protein